MEQMARQISETGCRVRLTSLAIGSSFATSATARSTVFLIPPGADLEKLRGGPDVTFEGLMPKAGKYRAWTQFRRNNKIHTFAFTFEAVAP